VGLRPEDDYFEACSSAWGFYINDSLRRLIAGGRAEPDSRQTTATQGEGAHERA
jgi:hypothetical protein